MKTIFRRFTIIAISLVIVFCITVPVRAQIQDWDDPANSCVVDGVPTLKCLEIVYGNILYVSSALVLLVLFIMIVYGGFTYLLSMGESAKVQKGQKILTWAIIGLVVFAGSYLILLVIDVAFMGGQGKIFRFNLPGP